MKDTICVAVGLVGGFFTAIFGGWDSALVTLVVFMAIDFFTGIITAMMKKIETHGKRRTFFQSRLVRSGEKSLHFNADRRCSSDGYSAEYQLYPGCCLHQLLPERTAFHRGKYKFNGNPISARNPKSN